MKKSKECEFVVELTVQQENGEIKTQYLEDFEVTEKGRPAGFSTTTKIKQAVKFNRINFPYLTVILNHILGRGREKRKFQSVRIARILTF